jgi:serine O-acetyltransferase
MEKFPGYLLNNTPSRTRVIQFTQSVMDYLFPVTDNPDAFIDTHEARLTALKHELMSCLSPLTAKRDFDVMEVADSFFSTLVFVKEDLLRDARMALEFDPAADSIEEVILAYPGFTTVMVYRLAHELYRLHVPIIPRIMSEWSHGFAGIDIHPGATIGCPFFIDHGTGVVIGETAVIGNYVKIYQGVTLGALAVKKEEAQQKRHPTIEDNVVIYAGSTILGGNTVVGHDTVIGASAWVTESVPPFSLVYQKINTIVKDKRDFVEPINFVI